ncbi:hypothetical protein GF327_08410, partial [Candidatus Woesearchaeota archaeon]|nr:hypothetical protein [Candidatus Woesearchaeota archaeon]
MKPHKVNIIGTVLMIIFLIINPVFAFNNVEINPNTFIAAASLLDGVVDGADALDTCVVNYDGIVSCGFSGFWVIVPLANGRVARKFVKKGFDVLDGLP